MRKGRVFGGLAGFLVLLALIYGIYLLVIAGEFKTIAPHFEGSCAQVPGVVGGEDIALLPGGDSALIAADDRRANARGPELRGGIYIYSPGDPETPPRLVSPEDAPTSLHPHGLDLHHGDGRTTVFVVNHRYPYLSGHAIEVYAWTGAALEHQRSVEDPLLRSPNDVVAVDHARFYATNDHGSSDAFGQKLEDYGRLARAGVVYYDGERFTEVASELRYANGLALSPDGGTLYVAATTDRVLHSFTRDPATGALSDHREQFVGTGIDNLDVEPDGTVWTAGHPKLLSFVRYAADPDKIAPSEVLRLTPGDYGLSVTQVLLDSGRQLSGSSSAVRSGDHLLVGTVHDPHILDCTMAAE
ncbi:MAG: SMP-30/gluconolactonase/LRE family protein [Nannocystaceae bacterium]|nr:SMP-30/gluconolactonase/LRE family protein [Myxococcales bacterium]